MKSEDIVRKIQYANVPPDVSREDIRHHCEIADEYGFQAVMIQACWVSMANDILRGTNINVETATAYPMGGETTAMKVATARAPGIARPCPVRPGTQAVRATRTTAALACCFLRRGRSASRHAIGCARPRIACSISAWSKACPPVINSHPYQIL